MPQRKRIFLKAVLLPLWLLAMAAAIFRRKPDAWEYEQTAEEAAVETPAATPASPHVAGDEALRARRRVLALFFAGAAFTAGAGDQMVRLMDEDAAALEAAHPDRLRPRRHRGGSGSAAPEAARRQPRRGRTGRGRACRSGRARGGCRRGCTDRGAAAAQHRRAAEPAAEAAPSTAAAPAAEPAAESAAAGRARSEQRAPGRTRPQGGCRSEALRSKRAPAARTSRRRSGSSSAQPLRRRRPPRSSSSTGRADDLAQPGPAGSDAGFGAAARAFAKQLVATSKRHGADWAAVLGVLRAQGERGSVPASARELDALAARLAGPGGLEGRTRALRPDRLRRPRCGAGRPLPLRRDRGARDRLRGGEGQARPEGALDPGDPDLRGRPRGHQLGRIDVRVVVLLGYLAERHGAITVSSLFSGHRKFARPGVVSAHIYGHAVDIAAVGGTSIAGHQQPGGITEAAVRSVLLLPAELQPQQVISLLGLGGPSFPLRDHGDHIHVGF